MLLVIDVGNTNTVIGIFDDDALLLADWRIETRRGRTADEHSMLYRQLIAARNLSADLVDAVVLACVVPPSQAAVEQAIRVTFRTEPLIVGPGIKTGMPILVDNPREVGADRIVNSLAAWQSCQQGCVVVDFGTATTFDVISEGGEYLGGVICPGLVISANALYREAAKLPRVPLQKPAKVVGKATVESMQSGLIFGYVGLVDGIIKRIREELDFEVRVFATGGQALIVADTCQHIDEIAPKLTLDGLRLLFELNH